MIKISKKNPAGIQQDSILKILNSRFYFFPE